MPTPTESQTQAARYSIQISWSEEDQAYVADVPALKYCSALGPTREKALFEIQMAMLAWLESCVRDGRPFPPA